MCWGLRGGFIQILVRPPLFHFHIYTFPCAVAVAHASVSTLQEYLKRLILGCKPFNVQQQTLVGCCTKKEKKEIPYVCIKDKRKLPDKRLQKRYTSISFSRTRKLQTCDIFALKNVFVTSVRTHTPRYVCVNTVKNGVWWWCPASAGQWKSIIRTRTGVYVCVPAHTVHCWKRENLENVDRNAYACVGRKVVALLWTPFSSHWACVWLVSVVDLRGKTFSLTVHIGIWLYISRETEKGPKKGEREKTHRIMRDPHQGDRNRTSRQEKAS